MLRRKKGERGTVLYIFLCHVQATYTLIMLCNTEAIVVVVVVVVLILQLLLLLSLTTTTTATNTKKL